MFRLKSTKNKRDTIAHFLCLCFDYNYVIHKTEKEILKHNERQLKT